MCRRLLCIVVTFCCMLPAGGFCSDKNIPQPVEWKSSLPKVADMGLDLNEIKHLIGEDGQFIFRRDPAPVTCWSKGAEKTFSDGVIVTAMKIVNAPVEKVRATILDCSLINEIQSQHVDVKIVSQKDNYVLYSFTQVYKTGVISLKSDFLVQQTLENDGSICTLLHDGDVDAQMQRWEFIPLDEDRTVLALTFWADYKTARFTFKVLLSCMAESHLFAPVMFCSMYLEQYGDYIEKDIAIQEMKEEDIRKKPETPIYTKQMTPAEKHLIDGLVIQGTVFLRTSQRAFVEGEVEEIPILSVFDQLNVPVEKAAPLISDINNFPEAIPIIKSIRKKNDDGSLIRINYSMGKFPMYLPLFVQQRYSDIQKTYLYFENDDKKGAYYPYFGAYEWDSINPEVTGGKDTTLYIYTHALKVGPDANLIIRTFNKLMNDAENLQLLVAAAIIVDSRTKWIENYYADVVKKEESEKSNNASVNHAPGNVNFFAISNN